MSATQTARERGYFYTKKEICQVQFKMLQREYEKEESDIKRKKRGEMKVKYKITVNVGNIVNILYI